MKSGIITSVMLGAMILSLTVVGIAEAKPGVISVHVSVKHTDGSNAAGILCEVKGFDSNNVWTGSTHGGITNNGGKAHIDVPNGDNSIIDLTIECNSVLVSAIPSDKGPTKVSVVIP